MKEGTFFPCLSFFSNALLNWFAAPCCRPPRRKATVPSVPGMLHVTRRAPSATSTCDGSSISDRWTLNLPCGRCFTCLHHRRESTATSTTGNRPRTSGRGTTLLSWSCSASGYVVSQDWCCLVISILFLPILPVWLNITKPFLCASVVSTIGFGLVLDMGVLETLKLLLWVVFVDCIGVGLLISTLMWWVVSLSSWLHKMFVIKWIYFSYLN